MKYSYHLDLSTESSEALFKSYTKKTRNLIKKAEKSGITVKVGKKYQEFLKLLANCYREKQLPTILPENRFDRVHSWLKMNDHGDFWVAETPSGRIIAGEYFVWMKQHALRWLAASISSHPFPGATAHLLHEIFIHFQEKGITSVNLLGANVPELASFLSGFNPKLVPQIIVTKFTIRH